jgi:hypothetical protein
MHGEKMIKRVLDSMVKEGKKGLISTETKVLLCDADGLKMRPLAISDTACVRGLVSAGVQHRTPPAL